MSIFGMHPHFDALAPHIGNQQAKHCHIISFTMGRPQHSASSMWYTVCSSFTSSSRSLGSCLLWQIQPQGQGLRTKNRSKHKCLLLLAKIHKTKQRHFLLARWSTCLLLCFDAFIHCDVLKLSSILTANYFKSHGPCGQWFASWFSFSNRLASSAGILQTLTVPKKSWIESRK